MASVDWFPFNQTVDWKQMSLHFLNKIGLLTKLLPTFVLFTLKI